MSGAECQELDEHTQHELREFAQLRVGKVAQSTQKPASRETAAGVKHPSPTPATLQKALGRIKAVLGNWFHAEVKARNLIQKPEEIVQFAKSTDAQTLEIGLLLKRGWTFLAAVREVIDRLTPDDEIRALHTLGARDREKLVSALSRNFWAYCGMGGGKRYNSCQD